MKEFWNSRYKAEAFAYGEQPNEFLKLQLGKIDRTGKILFPADGEGRNSVYAATSGWEVTAFDISEAGKDKALSLAEKHKTSINYLVGTLDKHHFQPNSFDALALVYAHFPPPILSSTHQALSNVVKSGGIVILEGFSKKHLKYQAENPKVGGPRSLEMLFSKEMIEQDFSDFEILYLEEEVVELQEGLFHNGKGAVIRFVGRKK